MRKLLAIILAVAMIAAFVPVVSATETSGEENGIAIVCDLGNILNGYPNSSNPLSQITTDANGVFKYVRSSITSGTTVKEGVVGSETPTNAAVIRYAGTGDKFHLRIYGGAYICFEITIPENGFYSMNVVSQKNKRGQVVNVYATDAETYYGMGTFGVGKLGEVMGSYSAYDSASSLNDISSGGAWETVTAFEEKYFEKGRYIITFNGADGNNEYDGAALRAPIGTFTLSGRAVSDEELGFVVKYDVDKTMKDNNVVYGTSYSARDLSYDTSNGFFSIAGTSGSVGLAGTLATATRFIKLKSEAVVVMNINVPQDGVYSLVTDYQKSKDGGVATVQVDGEVVGTYDCSGGTSNMGGNVTTWEPDFVVAKDLNLTAGEHSLRITVGGSNVYASIANFKLVSGMGKFTTKMGGFIKTGKTTLLPGEETTASVLAYLSDGSVDADAQVSALSSSDDSVIKVTNNTVKAVAVGIADLEATVDGKKITRTITVENLAVSGNVSFAAIGEGVTVSGITDYNVGDIASVKLGTKITVTAEDKAKSGVEFLGWYRGSRNNGVWITDELSYSFNIMSNTYLTAVYAVASNKEGFVDVAFYNGNGQFLAKKSAAIGVDTLKTIAPEASMTGFVFKEWVTQNGPLDDLDTFNADTNAVAQYDPSDVTYTVNGVGGYQYDAEVEYASNDGDVTWYLNGKAVAYGSNYVYRVWNDANVTSEKVVTKGPIIAIEDKQTDDAYMISYDANGSDIVEVGILFGNGAIIGSCEGKAVSKATGKVRGQFTAKADATDARGYLIYRDGNTYRVIYAD